MKNRDYIFIYDTTLRDGTQGEGISFSSSDKIQIAHKMDDFGIDYIEGGWPASNPRDTEFFELAKKEIFSHAKLTAFGSTRRKDTLTHRDPQIKALIEVDTPAVAIFGKTWKLHVTDVLFTSPEENLSMIYDSVAYLKKKGKEVLYDAEHFFDGYKDDPDYAIKTLEAAKEAGADFLVLCDTNGGSQVQEFSNIVKKVKRHFPNTRLGVHCHNDCGLGVAVSIAGIENGAIMVQGTINGYGERVGNANLTTIIPNLRYKLKYKLGCQKNLKKLKTFTSEIDRMANLIPNSKAPYVGDSAFAHKGGVHANAARKVARSYEHIIPSKIGNKQRILLSDLAGSSSVYLKATKMGINLEEKSKEMRSFTRKLKSLENFGYEYENADASFLVLLYQHFHGFEDSFELVSYRTISEVTRDTGRNLSEAVVKIRSENDPTVRIFAGESAGPVGALDHAMRAAFSDKFPQLGDVEIIDYKVRILQAGMGADSIVQVLMNSGDGTETWWTCGANPNIIEASWQALRDSFRYKMISKKV